MRFCPGHRACLTPFRFIRFRRNASRLVSKVMYWLNTAGFASRELRICSKFDLCLTIDRISSCEVVVSEFYSTERYMGCEPC